MENETKMMTEAEELMEALCEAKELELLDGCEACEEACICPAAEEISRKEKISRKYQEVKGKCIEVKDKCITGAKDKYQIAKEKCVSAKETCCNTAERLVNDWKETAGNPYIKHTCINKVEIYRDPADETPVDSFETEKVNAYSMRAVALVGAASMLFTCATKFVARQIAKKLY